MIVSEGQGTSSRPAAVRPCRSEPGLGWLSDRARTRRLAILMLVIVFTVIFSLPESASAQRGRFGILPPGGLRPTQGLLPPGGLLSRPAIPRTPRPQAPAGGFGSRIFGQSLFGQPILGNRNGAQTRPGAQPVQPQPIPRVIMPGVRPGSPLPSSSASVNRRATNRNSARPINSTSQAPPINSPGEIRLSHPETATTPMVYSLNGTDFKLMPGKSVLLAPGSEWNLEFSAGGDFGQRVASLEPGKQYIFEQTKDEGWVLMMDVPKPETKTAEGTSSPQTPPADKTSAPSSSRPKPTSGSLKLEEQSSVEPGNAGQNRKDRSGSDSLPKRSILDNDG